jgi:thiamine biosynthesis lipoprotein
MRVKYFLLIACLLLFGSCADSPQAPTERTDFALGTFVSVRIYGDFDESALDSAFLRLHEVEAVASAKNPTSELFYVNQNAYEREIIVSEELFFLLETGLYYSALTDGAFDITLGAIVELWGIGTDFARVPEADEIAEAVENSGFEHLVLNESERTVRFLREGLRIDLGAFAKGYAADEMRCVLLENGVTSAILDLGGDIIIIGDNAGKNRRIGIADPQNPAAIRAILQASDMAVMTSGDYERFFEHENTRYHHIFDRRTGFPADSGIISATVIANCPMRADALSTALFVTGEPLPDADYILIDNNGNINYTGSLEIEIIN